MFRLVGERLALLKCSYCNAGNAILRRIYNLGPGRQRLCAWLFATLYVIGAAVNLGEGMLIPIMQCLYPVLIVEVVISKVKIKLHYYKPYSFGVCPVGSIAVCAFLSA